MRNAAAGSAALIFSALLSSCALAPPEEPLVVEPVVTDIRTAQPMPAGERGPCARTELAVDLGVEVDTISVTDCVQGEWALVRSETNLHGVDDMIVSRNEARWSKYAQLPSELCASDATADGVPEPLLGHFPNC